MSTRQSHTIAVFQPLTQTGRHFIDAALLKHRVYALVQDPLQLPHAWTQHPQFHAVAGSIADSAAVSSLVGSAGTAVLLGGTESPSSVLDAVNALDRAISHFQTPALTNVHLLSSNPSSPSVPLQQAEQSLAAIHAKHPSIQYTVFHVPPTDTTPAALKSDLVLMEEAQATPVAPGRTAVSTAAVADAVLEVVETQPRFVNKTVGMYVHGVDAGAVPEKETVQRPKKDEADVGKEVIVEKKGMVWTWTRVLKHSYAALGGIVLGWGLLITGMVLLW